MEQAIKQYKAGDYAGAVNNLDYASQLIRQKKSEGLVTVLPSPLEGWKAGEPQAQAVGAAMLGGGTTVSRDYTKGESTVTVSIVTDSPLMQSMMMMLNTPMFAGASGGKLQTINGERAIVNYTKSQQNGDINIVVNNRFLVTVQGNNASLEDMISYAKAIDMKKLKEM